MLLTAEFRIKTFVIINIYKKITKNIDKAIYFSHNQTSKNFPTGDHKK
jgi:hypothetical protein